MKQSPHAYRLVISGRVQGVSYRAWMAKTAQSMGIAGWVRNLPNGTVEALVSGPRDEIDSLIKACNKGPLLARVTGVQALPHDGEPPEGEFKIRRP